MMSSGNECYEAEQGWGGGWHVLYGCQGRQLNRRHGKEQVQRLSDRDIIVRERIRPF